MLSAFFTPADTPVAAAEAEPCTLLSPQQRATGRQLFSGAGEGEGSPFFLSPPEGGEEAWVGL